MKNTFFILLLILFATSTGKAQEIIGSWNGVLKVTDKMQLRIVFNISNSEKGLTATMDSPDQKAYGIPVSETTFEKPKLRLFVKQAAIEYVGELIGDSIVGTFKQGGQSFPVVLSKTKAEAKVIVRPQDPKQPYPYLSEDITFVNKQANITLGGTLTMPKGKGKYAAVVLVTGSGAQDRNEELLGHKPFLILSDYLTRNGIAVLRFDDRGVGQSGGDFSKSTSFDFATDVKAAIDYLKTCKEIDASKIGVMGHSEGGLIAPIVASENPADVGFIVLLAGPGLPGSQIIMMQQELIGRANGMPEADLQKAKQTNKKVFDIVMATKQPEKLRSELSKLLNDFIKDDPKSVPEGMTNDEFVNMQLDQLLSPWMLNFLTFDPVTALEKVRCPVLALNGEKDLQVPPKENLSKIKETLTKAGNKKVTTLELAGLNHIFQECTTGSPNEYAEIEQTMSPKALAEIAKWVKKQTK